MSRRLEIGGIGRSRTLKIGGFGIGRRLEVIVGKWLSRTFIFVGIKGSRLLEIVVVGISRSLAFAINRRRSNLEIVVIGITRRLACVGVQIRLLEIACVSTSCNLLIFRSGGTCIFLVI